MNPDNWQISGWSLLVQRRHDSSISNSWDSQQANLPPTEIMHTSWSKSVGNNIPTPFQLFTLRVKVKPDWKSKYATNHLIFGNTEIGIFTEIRSQTEVINTESSAWIEWIVYMFIYFSRVILLFFLYQLWFYQWGQAHQHGLDLSAVPCKESFRRFQFAGRPDTAKEIFIHKKYIFKAIQNSPLWFQLRSF